MNLLSLILEKKEGWIGVGEFGEGFLEGLGCDLEGWVVFVLVGGKDILSRRNSIVKSVTVEYLKFV